MGRLSSQLSPSLALLVIASLACGPKGDDRETTPVVRIAAPAPGATQYTTTPTAGSVEGPRAEELVGGVSDAAAEFNVEIQADGRLSTLAAWVGARLGEGGAPPPHEVVEFFAHHLGLVEPVPHLLILGLTGDASLRSGITDSMRQFLTRQTYNFYGASVVQRDQLTIAVVTLATRNVELEPLNRQVDANTEVRLRGRLRTGFARPELAIAPPRGEVVRVPAGAGPEIDIALPISGAGTYKIEVLAQGPRGDTVLTNFPLYVGTEPPNEVVLQTSGGEDESNDAEGVARALFAQINQSRAQNGLPPLESHDGLAGVARAHSQDMVANNFVGHTSPTTGDAPGRVRGAGYRSGLILENIGRGYSASEIHRGLLASPGHAANVLNRDVTHVGVGVVGETEGEREAFVATEVFIRMNREISAEAAGERLLRMINDGRRARGATPLEADPNLTTAAQSGADSYFENPDQSQQDTVDDASSQLRRFAVMFRRVGGLMAVVSDVEEAGRLEPTFDPDLRYIGIGVRQGDRPDAPPNSVAVVIMLAWPR